MTKNSQIYTDYVSILLEELVVAMGCTEPISLAYAAAKTRDVLGAVPDSVELWVSGNIVKNVKSVIVPNTDGKQGLEASIAAGFIFGKSEKLLEVISEASAQQKAELNDYLKKMEIAIHPVQSESPLDIRIRAHKDEDVAEVHLAETHTNIISVSRNGEVLYSGQSSCSELGRSPKTDRSCLNLADIFDFAESVELDDVREVLARQVKCNSEIADEGLRGGYGAEIGRVLLNVYGSDHVARRASARAAAGSDARMSGCEMPVVINSGSGNQGITISVPIIEYAEHLQSGEEKMYRALVLANLLAVYLKTGIGVLSAYCGAVSAGVASGAGIAYLYGGDLRIIAHTVVNALAIASGIICDGAKASCAAKIATAVDAGILGFHMIDQGFQFRGGDGIVTKGADATIRNIARLGKEGMFDTDRVILDIMTASKLPNSVS